MLLSIGLSFSALHADEQCVEQCEQHRRQRSRESETKLGVAAGVGFVLCSVSLLLLWLAAEPTDVAALAGGIGLSVGSALLGLSAFVFHWMRSGTRAYVSDTYAGSVRPTHLDDLNEDQQASAS